MTDFLNGYWYVLCMYVLVTPSDWPKTGVTHVKRLSRVYRKQSNSLEKDSVKNGTHSGDNES